MTDGRQSWNGDPGIYTQGSPQGQPTPSTPDIYAKYHLDRHSQTQTGQQVQDQVDQDLNSKYGPFGPLVAMTLGGDQVVDRLDAQAASLKQGALIRTAPSAPGTVYIGIPHTKLHDMVNNGVDPGAVGTAGDTWTNIGNKLTTFQDRIASAIGSSETQWTGTAGEAARQAVAGIGNRAGATGTSAQLAGTLWSQQSRALSTAKASVPPPPAQPFDPTAANAKLQTITDPLAYAKQAAADQAAYHAQEQAHQDAARAVQTYDQTVAQTAAAQPAFAPPPQTTITPPKDGDPATPPGNTPPGNRGNTGVPQIHGNTGNTNTSGSTNTNPSQPGAQIPAPQIPSPGQHTDSSSSTPPTTAPAWSGPSDIPGPPGSTYPTIDAPGRRPLSGDLAVGPPFGGLPGGTGDGGGTNRGGLGRGAGGLGNTGRGGPGVGGVRGGTPGGNGTGMRGGAPGNTPGARALAAEQAGAGRGGTGAAGAKGVAGQSGVGAMGGARGGKGGEDGEHKSASYLMEPDTDEIFGTDEMVAPPVIGE
ncbi:hypothetical protein F0L68_21255 [Solihabitans fulvus]|uniref:PPE family protein n=1 Tax=Solihabitans fulvus TaxID=1892852 RepID=A0A5B2X8I7_9PSEU|nr:hypothetical protein [Solihabitans fulvus]KAA2259466.1 hypothetical protein F0L68_21255 [Solihabitans fulvus]